MRQFDVDFYCLFVFWNGFFSKWFFQSIHSPIILGLVLCLVNENSLNCTSGLVLLCFFISSSCVTSFFALSGASFFVHARD